MSERNIKPYQIPVVLESGGHSTDLLFLADAIKSFNLQCPMVGTTAFSSWELDEIQICSNVSDISHTVTKTVFNSDGSLIAYIDPINDVRVSRGYVLTTLLSVAGAKLEAHLRWSGRQISTVDILVPSK